MKQEKIWDYFQNEGEEHFWGSRGRQKFIIKRILNLSKNKGNKTPKVLDIGVGDGFFELFANRNGLDIYALDPNERSIAGIKKMLSNINNIDNKFVVGYGQKIPFPDNYFDFVVISEVIEHLDTDILLKTLKEIRRILNNKGSIIVTTPSNESLKISETVCPYCGKKFHRWGHVQSFTVSSLGHILSAYFEVRKIYIRPFIDWGNRDLIKKIFGLIKMTLYYIGYSSEGETIVAIGNKNP